MTFRELVQIEKYIQEINNIKRLSISGDELRVRGNILNGQISSSVKGYAPKGINWNDAWGFGINIPKVIMTSKSVKRF